MPPWWRISPKSSRRSRSSGAVHLRVAADVVVDPGMELAAVGAVPGLACLVAALDEDGVGAPVLELAREPVAALEQQDALAGRGELVHERAAARAGADHDDVVIHQTNFG